MTLYAAYGTNLDPARMGERCPPSPLRATGWLIGWRLSFGGEEHGWDCPPAKSGEHVAGRLTLKAINAPERAQVEIGWDCDEQRCDCLLYTSPSPRD